MNGVSHFTIGCAACAACVYVGIAKGDPVLVASGMTMPVGAMLPDIDHHATKLGRQRIAVTSTIRNIAVIGSLGYVGVTGVTSYISAGLGAMTTSLFGVFVSALPILICLMITTSESFKKKTKFFRKHRGIMHTLIPVAGLMLGAYMILNNFISSMLFGIGIGYLTHLVADCQTHDGCPILWPITEKCVRIPLFNVRTGTAGETIWMLLDIGGIACLASLVCSL